MIYKETWKDRDVSILIRMNARKERLDGPGMYLLRQIEPSGLMKVGKYSEKRVVLEGKHLMKLTEYLSGRLSLDQLLEVMAQLVLLPAYLQMTGLEEADLLWQAERMYVHLGSHQLILVPLPVKPRLSESYPVFYLHLLAYMKSKSPGMPQGESLSWMDGGFLPDAENGCMLFKKLQDIHPGLTQLCQLWYGTAFCDWIRERLRQPENGLTGDPFGYFRSCRFRDMEWKTEPVLTRLKTRQRYLVSKAIFRIGKTRQMDLSLPDAESVSRVHALIVYREEGYFVQDLYSKNGTYVGGHLLLPMKEAFIGPGQELMLGDERFVFDY